LAKVRERRDVGRIQNQLTHKQWHGRIRHARSTQKRGPAHALGFH